MKKLCLLYWTLISWVLVQSFVTLFSLFSEGSCDTEDWSNNPENSALITAKKNLSLTFGYQNLHKILLIKKNQVI